MSSDSSSYPAEVQKGPCKLVGLLRAQSMFHGSDSVLAPCMILLSMGAVLSHQKLTSQALSDGVTTKFMMQTLLQMAPLAFADMKILGCGQPVELFVKFSEKVLMMSSFALAFRILGDWIVGHALGHAPAFLLLAGAVLVGIYGFRPTLRRLLYHYDVWCLLLLALAFAGAEEFAEFGFVRWHGWLAGTSPAFSRKRMMSNFFAGQLSGYVEILAFVPAVWTILHEGRREAAGPSVGAHSRAVAFFAWHLGFYLFEDLQSAWEWSGRLPGAAVAHLVHFALVLDFAAFFLAHLYDPSKLAKLGGCVVAWLQDACAV